MPSKPGSSTSSTHDAPEGDDPAAGPSSWDAAASVRLLAAIATMVEESPASESEFLSRLVDALARCPWLAAVAIYTRDAQERSLARVAIAGTDPGLLPEHLDPGTEETLTKGAARPLMHAGSRLGLIAWVSREAADARATRDLMDAVAPQCAAAVVAARARGTKPALGVDPDTYRSIVEGMAEMVCRFQPDGLILFVNAAYARSLGVTPGELIGQNFWEFVPAADRPAVREMLHRLTPERPQVTIENPFVSADGVRWTIWTNRGLRFDEDGRLLEAQSSGLDITERRRAEEARRESEQRFRLMADAAPVLVWLAGGAGECTWFNKPWLDFVGSSLEQDVGEGWTRHVHPDDRQRVTSTRSDAAAAGTAFSMDYRLRRRDGVYRWVMDNGAPLETGRGLIGSCVDVTERREAEEALRESEQLFKVMANTAPAMLWITDAEARATFISRGWLEYTGQTEAGAIHDGWLDAVHPDDRERTAAEFHAASAARRPFTVDYRVRRADGAYRWVADTGQPRFDDAGAFLGYIGSVIDVHERKHAEESLARHAEALEMAVQSATSELRQAYERERLQERMAALGTLAAGLGHDMGNLLVPVRVRLETLASMQLPAEAGLELSGIRVSLDYLQKLSGGLRLLSVDPSRGGRSDPTELREWWAEAHSVLKAALPRGVAFTFEPPASEVWAAMPRAALLQAVFNLVQNAGDALRDRPDGLVCARVDAGDQNVSIIVQDNGPGMTDEVRRRCMEPFFTTKSRTVSTGLGLALVYGLVRDAGGAINLESAPGLGTTFTITVKRAASPRIPSADRRRAAIVNIRDIRLRSIITNELRILEYDVRFGAGETADAELAVMEDASADGALLVQAVGVAGRKAIPLAPRPRLLAIRAALRRTADDLVGGSPGAPGGEERGGGE